MKKKIAILCTMVFLSAAMITTTTSCARKKGCPINENAHVKPDSKGNFGTKRGKTSLFPKQMKKRKKKKKKIKKETPKNTEEN